MPRITADTPPIRAPSGVDMADFADPETPSKDRRWIVLAVLCLSVFLVVVDNTIVNVALPTLNRTLGRVHHVAPVDRRRLQPGVRRAAPRRRRYR